MVCVYCGNKTKVFNSRLQKRNNQVWRRRQCSSCHAVFTTEETIDYGGSWTVKSKSGVITPFSREKLVMSLFRSCQHRKGALSDASALTDTIINKLHLQRLSGSIDTDFISHTAQVALNRFDKAASVHYQAWHRS
ncbi:MAG TPA: hypothetical protein VLF79_02455 [Candidatus Saccharimonadales bacterium]|nr:hypothetical protein [Candidatus Saccharimonadales bacterium]